MIKKIHACNKMNFSSNINEVIRAVLNSIFVFFIKRFHTHKKHQKAPKCNKAKTQNSNRQTKIKNALKTPREKEVTYSLICIFCACKEKKIKK